MIQDIWWNRSPKVDVRLTMSALSFFPDIRILSDSEWVWLFILACDIWWSDTKIWISNNSYFSTGKPYRDLIDNDSPAAMKQIFETACRWSAFTVSRTENLKYVYQTFICKLHFDIDAITFQYSIGFELWDKYPFSMRHYEVDLLCWQNCQLIEKAMVITGWST